MNILTFDIEDWFHTHENRQRYSGHIWTELPSKVIDNTRLILDMLERHQRKATFFILGWVAKYYPSLVKEILEKGHEIGSHSFWHHNPHLIKLSDFEKDLKLSLDILQDIAGEKVVAYRAPGFNLALKDSEAFDILVANGITIDSSIKLKNKSVNEPFFITTKKGEILEFPQLTGPLGLPFSGGGFFRAYPQKLLDYLYSKTDYHLLYFHPRDFDRDYPSSNLFSFHRNMMNAVNTATCQKRLENFFAGNKTLSIFEAAEVFEKHKNIHRG